MTADALGRGGAASRTSGRRPDLGRPIAEVKADLFKALGHPPRIRIVEALSEGERAVGELQLIVGIESSHLSQQLGVLRRAGILTTRREGSSVIYALSDPVLIELLDVAKRFLITSLSSTESLLADLRGGVL